LRNKVIHSYDSINDATIWAIIVNHLPNLKNEIIELVNYPFAKDKGGFLVLYQELFLVLR